jgi:hypothetical protein
MTIPSPYDQFFEIITRELPADRILTPSKETKCFPALENVDQSLLILLGGIDLPHFHIQTPEKNKEKKRGVFTIEYM